MTAMITPTSQKPSLQEAADLTGLDLSSMPIQSPFDAEGDAVELAAPAPGVNPEQCHTQRSLAAHPYMKLGIIGGACLLGFLVLGLVLQDVMQPFSRLTAAATTEAAQTLEQPLTEEEIWNRADAETGTLKTELALAKQADELASLEDTEAKPAEDESETAKTETEVQPQTKPQPQVVRPAPVVTPHPALAPRVVTRIQAPPAPIEPEPKLTPAQQWLAAAGMTQFGTVTPGIAPPVSSNTVPQSVPSPIASVAGPAPGNAFTTSPPMGSLAATPPVRNIPSVLPGAKPIIQAFVPNSTPGLIPPLNRRVQIGTEADAELLSAIAWPSDASDHYLIKLKDAIKDTDGHPVLSKGTQLIAGAQNLNIETGVADLAVVGVLLNDETYAIPAGTLSIRSASGAPLLAENLNDASGTVLGRDLSNFAVAALSGIGAELTKPQSTTTTTSLGGFSSQQTINNAGPNLLGGAVRQGFGQLSDTMTERNAAAIQTAQNQPVIWGIKAGTELQIFVNQTWRLP
ncbi:MAG: hypothetical protein AAGF24_04060 [Cyanobacteria bacterium P01_H01_bin.121]